MDLVLTGLQSKKLFVYMDDIVIYANSLEKHEKNYNLLMDRLRNVNLKLQPNKCEFLKIEITYLGCAVSKDGVRPNPNKLEAVKKTFLGPRHRKILNNF